MSNERSTTVVGPRSPHRAEYQSILHFATLCGRAGIESATAIRLFREGLAAAAHAHASPGPASSDPFAASQILSEWHENVRFLTPDGSPARLSVSHGDFEALCEAAGVTIDPQGLLESLIRSKAVRQDGDLVCVATREVIVGDDDPSGSLRALRLVGDLAATCNHNLTRPTGAAGRFERTVSNGRLSRRHLPALIAYLSAHGESFLEDLDAWMVAREDENHSPTVGVGVYLFVEDQEGMAPSATSDGRSLVAVSEHRE